MALTRTKNPSSLLSPGYHRGHVDHFMAEDTHTPEQLPKMQSLSSLCQVIKEVIMKTSASAQMRSRARQRSTRMMRARTTLASTRPPEE